jgi:5'-3' exonuclease
LIDEKQCLKEIGVLPRHVAMFKAFAGDSSDNIPGCHGIGPVNAAKLVLEGDTVDEIIESQSPSGKLRATLELGKAMTKLSLQLVKLKRHDFEMKLTKHRGFSEAIKIWNKLEMENYDERTVDDVEF